MNIVNKILASLPIAIMLGFGVGVFYLIIIMYYVTGDLPNIDIILNHLSGFKQIIEVLKG